MDGSMYGLRSSTGKTWNELLRSLEDQAHALTSAGSTPAPAYSVATKSPILIVKSGEREEVLTESVRDSIANWMPR